MPTPTRNLGKFEGRRVSATRMTVKGTGDGLSEALEMDPLVLHHGDEVYLIVKGVVADVHFPPVKGTEDVARTHVIRAVEATIVEEALAEPALVEQRRKIREALEAETGQEPLGDGLRAV